MSPVLCFFFLNETKRKPKHNNPCATKPQKKYWRNYIIVWILAGINSRNTFPKACWIHTHATHLHKARLQHITRYQSTRSHTHSRKHTASHGTPTHSTYTHRSRTLTHPHRVNATTSNGSCQPFGRTFLPLLWQYHPRGGVGTYYGLETRRITWSTDDTSGRW